MFTYTYGCVVCSIVITSLLLCNWFTFDFQVGSALGVGRRVRHLSSHGDPAVVQDQSVLGALLDDVNILSHKNMDEVFTSHTTTQ